jgi:hypothetical protein
MRTRDEDERIGAHQRELMHAAQCVAGAEGVLLDVFKHVIKLKTYTPGKQWKTMDDTTDTQS